MPRITKSKVGSKSKVKLEDGNNSFNESIERVISQASRGLLNASSCPSDSDFDSFLEDHISSLQTPKKSVKFKNTVHSSNKRKPGLPDAFSEEEVGLSPLSKKPRKLLGKKTTDNSPLSRKNIPSKVEVFNSDDESKFKTTQKNKVCFPKRPKERKNELSFLNNSESVIEKEKIKENKKVEKRKGRKIGRNFKGKGKEIAKSPSKIEQLAANSSPVDIASGQTIEALTELVRQKRVRPPYGQPYSVIGSWYIASGYLKDLASMLESFEKKSTARFADFAECWREMHFTQVYRGRQSFKELLEFSEEILLLTKKFIDPDHSEKRRIGALYTLYGLYYKHPIRQQFNLRFTPSQYKNLLEVMELQSPLVNPDPARILVKLHVDSAIVHVATDSEMCIGLHSSFEASSVNTEYGYLRLAQSSTVPRALSGLSLDDEYMQEYCKAKTASEEESVPDKALCLFNNKTSQDVKEELLKLEDYTLDLLSFRGKHAVYEREKFTGDPALTLGSKRYEIKRRAESIAAAEAQQALANNVLNVDNTPESLARKTLSIATNICDINSSVYVGKMEYRVDDDSKHDIKSSGMSAGTVLPIELAQHCQNVEGIDKCGASPFKKKKGRPVKYVNVKNCNPPIASLAAISKNISKRNKSNRFLDMVKRKKLQNFSLVKGSIMQELQDPLEDKDKSGILANSAPVPLTSVGGDGNRKTELPDTIEQNTDGLCEATPGGWTSNEDFICDRKENNASQDHTLLDMRIEMKVNGSREERCIKANVSAQQFMELKQDKTRLRKLHEKILLMMLPKLQVKYGRDCEVSDLMIVKVRRCLPDVQQPQDYITGNEPLVQSGTCNVKRRLRMVERYNKKTPIKPMIEDVKDSNNAATLVPIIVGKSMKYIQASSDPIFDEEKDQTNIEMNPFNNSCWVGGSVVRTHNCNWMKNTSYAQEFKNFKNHLNNFEVPGVSATRSIKRTFDNTKYVKKGGFSYIQLCDTTKEDPVLPPINVSTREKKRKRGRPRSYPPTAKSHRRKQNDTSKDENKIIKTEAPDSADEQTNYIFINERKFVDENPDSSLCNESTPKISKTISPKRKRNSSKRQKLKDAGNKITDGASGMSLDKTEDIKAGKVDFVEGFKSMSTFDEFNETAVDSFGRMNLKLSPDSRNKRNRNVHSNDVYITGSPTRNEYPHEDFIEDNNDSESISDKTPSHSPTRRRQRKRGTINVSGLIYSKKNVIDDSQSLSSVTPSKETKTTRGRPSISPNKNQTIEAYDSSEKIKSMKQEPMLFEDIEDEWDAYNDNFKPTIISYGTESATEETSQSDAEQMYDAPDHSPLNNETIDDVNNPLSNENIDDGPSFVVQTEETQNKENQSEIASNKVDIQPDSESVHSNVANHAKEQPSVEESFMYVKTSEYDYVKVPKSILMPSTNVTESTDWMPKDNSYVVVEDLSGSKNKIVHETCEYDSLAPITPSAPQYNSDTVVTNAPPFVPCPPHETNCAMPATSSYIRAITDDGAAILLPTNTYFSIVQNDGTETNATKLDFSEPTEAIMLCSRPVMPDPPSSQVDSEIASSDAIFASSEAFQVGSPLSPAALLAPASVTDRNESQKTDLMATLDLKPSSLQAESPVVNNKMNLRQRRTPQKVYAADPGTGRLSLGHKKASPSLVEKLDSVVETQKSVPKGVKSSPTKPRNRKSDALIKITPTLSESTAIAQRNLESSSSLIPSTNNSMPSSTPQASSVSKKPVCNFLLTKKFKPLQSALGSAVRGDALGTPSLVKKHRVSFFMRGSLKF